MKKESNPAPTAKKPTYPASESKKEKLAKIFNEWARRYAENPDSFSEILDSEGKPVTDYGECSAEYFCQIERELDL